MTRAKQVRRKTLAQHAASIEQAVNALNTAQFEAIKKIFSINNETLPNAEFSVQEFQVFLEELDALFVQGSTAVAAINETINNFGLTKLVYTPPAEEAPSDIESIAKEYGLTEASLYTIKSIEEDEDTVSYNLGHKEDLVSDITEETDEDEDLPVRF